MTVVLAISSPLSWAVVLGLICLVLGPILAAWAAASSDADYDRQLDDRIAARHRR